MTVYPYQPPEREYTSTITAFHDWQLASTWSVRVSSDPLGDVNRIVTLMRGGKPVKSALARVPAGAEVRLIRDDGAWTISDLHAFLGALWDSRGTNAPTPKIDISPPGWRVEVDGRTVLAVTDAEMQPPRTPPPAVPWRRRARRALITRRRARADAIAKRLGYHRDEDCTGWDE